MSDYAEAIKNELREAGVSFDLAHGGKHLHLTWTGVNGRRRKFVLASTSSDRRAYLNARSDIRKMLRHDGNLPPRASAR